MHSEIGGTKGHEDQSVHEAHNASALMYPSVPEYLWSHNAQYITLLSHTPHCFEGVRMMFVNRPWAIHVW